MLAVAGGAGRPAARRRPPPGAPPTGGPSSTSTRTGPSRGGWRPRDTSWPPDRPDRRPTGVSWRCWRRRRSRARWRRRRRRSRSDSPPQIPNFSPLARAYSRQSSRTTHPRHTSLASRVDAPRSGKKRSGSTPMQLARFCQLRSWGPNINDTMSIDGCPSHSSMRSSGPVTLVGRTGRKAHRPRSHGTDVTTDMSSFTIRARKARRNSPLVIRCARWGNFAGARTAVVRRSRSGNLTECLAQGAEQPPVPCRQGHHRSPVAQRLEEAHGVPFDRRRRPAVDAGSHRDHVGDVDREPELGPMGDDAQGAGRR